MTLVSLLVLAGCSDSGGSNPDANQATDAADDLDQSGDALPGEPFVPVPIGEPASATIGSAGGTLTSTDGHRRLDFPNGAVAADTAVAIQQIEWEDGLGWSLSPEGAEFAVPVVATVTLSEEEVGTPARVQEESVESLDLPIPVFSYMTTSAEGDDTVSIEPDWRETDGEIDYALALAHFSWLEVTLVSAILVRNSLNATADVGDTFPLDAVTLRAVFERRPLPARCALPEGGTELRTINEDFRVLFGSLAVDPGRNGHVALVGSPTPVAGGFEQTLRCETAGTDSVPFRVFLEVEFEDPTLQALMDLCTLSGTVVPLSADVTCQGSDNGAACQDASECTSSHCADGVCCDTACDDDCEACNLPGSEGFCDDIPEGQTDPGLCDSPDACDGVGVCVKANGAVCEDGAECLSGFCVDHTCCENDCTGTCIACNVTVGTGFCENVPEGDVDLDTCELPDTCDGAGNCNSEPRGNGAACSSTDQCESGFCPPDDGVCCDEACDSPCRACTADKSRSADGICDAIAEDTDPDSECPDPQTCQARGDVTLPITAYCTAHNADPCTDEGYSSDCPGAGYCRDGVCCDNACTSGGPCYGCTMAHTGQDEGHCAPCLSCSGGVCE